jgi:hypothetical protein
MLRKINTCMNHARLGQMLQFEMTMKVYGVTY